MILINGTVGGEVSVLDRGFAYGDGLFETIAVIEGDILNWPRHTERLDHGCRRLAIATPNFDQLLEETRAVAAGHDRSVVKITLTRGVGGRGYTPPAVNSATRIVARAPWPENYTRREQNGIRVCVARHRLPVQPDLAGLKHLNRLDQVLASLELAEHGTDEAVMLDLDGRVVEATRCNLFAIYGERLTTPRLHRCGVRGVMRAIVLQLAPTVGLAPEETELTLDDLRAADEVFLCNAVAGIWPVIELDDSPRLAYRIGGHTRGLQAALIAGDHHR